jgi:electron transfer flavoprotein alpha/beta subunit
MRIAVCVKQVPTPRPACGWPSDGRWIDEEDLPFVLNESDEYALEEALRSPRRPAARWWLQRRTRRGCGGAAQGAGAGRARAVHLADAAFPAATPSATGRALAAAIAARGAVDLVL